jgi:hypothetical protein
MLAAPPGDVEGICWLCRRLCEEARDTPFEVGAAATGRAELLGMVVVMVADIGAWADAGVGCDSTGRR